MRLEKTYYPYWRKKMTKKFGEEKMKEYVFEDCLEEWIVVNWAWESKDD